MKSLIKKREQGFTLIEIVIVLAIAAALILVVFLAVSGAQKSKRDTVTKQNAGELGSQIENYESNNGGNAPTAALSLAYLGNIVDGQGGTPSYRQATAAGISATSATNKEIQYSGAAQCSGGSMITSGNTNAYAVVYWSESGGTSVCIDNQ